jgi:pimeloyl-ACP methyl ester carboxylesterase
MRLSILLLVLSATATLAGAPLTAASGTSTPASASGAVTDRSGPRLSRPFAPCRLTDPSQLNSIEGECATVEIAETDAPGSRRISLSLARIPAVNHKRKGDPLVILAGGPGMGAQLMYTSTAAAFARARRDRDILLLDQRGTGGSAPLNCEGDLDDPLAGGGTAFDVESFVKLVDTCRDALAAGHDLRAYTTSRAVRDLDAVRALLGYEALNLYAVSYGTRVAQHYARRHPERVRSMVLDGVVAPGTVLGPRIALDAQLALDGTWKRCAADKDCRDAFGDVGGQTRQLQAALQRQPQRVQIAHPRTGAIESIDFGAQHLAMVLRFGSYQASFAAMLPLVVHLAARGDFRPLATLYLLTTSSLVEAVAVGMHNSVVCSEDLPRVDAAAVDRKALEATYMGASMFEAIRSSCEKWPRGEVDADFHAPLAVTVPTLLLSGTLDPVTPPGDADRVAKSLRNVRHLKLEGAGHGQVDVPCMDRVLAEFFNKADPRALDTSCLERRRQMPFWITLAGPSP